MGPIAIIIIVFLLMVITVLIITNVKIVPQSRAYVIEWLGAYKTTWQTGFHIKVPFIERIARNVSLKEQVVDFPPQPVITKDNVTMQIDTVVFFQITDPKLYAYGVENPISAIENLTATTLRNIIGELELDHTLTSRDTINAKIRGILDEATDPWGIKVNRVELKNILPPREIQDAMEKQSLILAAEADKRAAILHAEAVKESKIREAEGEAEAIRTIQQAEAQAIEFINQAKPGEGYLTMRKLEAFEKAADGQATKIIIPSEIQGAAGLAAGITETLKK